MAEAFRDDHTLCIWLVRGALTLWISVRRMRRTTPLTCWLGWAIASSYEATFRYAVSAGPDVLANFDLIPGIHPYSRVSYQQKKLSTQYFEITLIRSTSQTLAETQQARQHARLSYLAIHQSNQQAMVETSVICLMSLM